MEDLSFFLSQHQDSRQKFRSVLVEATVKLDELVKKIGKAVDESKPYWEARRLARQVSPQRCNAHRLTGRESQASSEAGSTTHTFPASPGCF